MLSRAYQGVTSCFRDTDTRLKYVHVRFDSARRYYSHLAHAPVDLCCSVAFGSELVKYLIIRC